jgi:signal transduction histidine kinase
LQDRERLRSHNVELSGRLEESLEEVRASRARIVAAADAERRRMERDLHDGAQQRLVMISLKLGMAGNLIESDPAAALALHEELSQDASRAIEELRDLAHGIYPPLLESDGLTSALEDIADQSPLPVAMECDGTDRFPAAVEAAVYFCCLEALQNVAKHAGAGTRAVIQLSKDEDELHFAVSDDGSGFDISAPNGSAGMQNMTDRIGALGGTICVTSRPGAGTKVEGWVPVQ